MSFSSLPQELVDNIARFVDVKPVWDQKDDFEHILSLSLVSKQTLASCRRVLYHEPFDRWEYQDDLITWRRARKLLKSLEANGGRFGKLVRRTNGIRGWMHELDETTQATESKSGGLLSWYQRVLRACPLLRQVDFIFSTERQMYGAFRILFFDLPEPHASTYSTSPLSPTSTIREIAFLGCPVEFLDTPRVSCAKVFSALRCSSIISLGSVTFYRVDWSMEEVNSIITLFPFRLRRLKMSTLFGGQFAPPPVLFSRSTETLEYVDLSGKAVLARFDLSALPSILGTNLRTLSMKFDSDWEFDRTLSTYTSYHDTPPLCPETFASFPHLENLELSATHGLSLRLLETLAKTSPLLSTLQFSYSRWISDQDPLSIDPDDIFPEPEIIAVLCKFLCLSLVDLGVLPALDRSRYQDMEDTLFEERTWARYDVCKKE